MDHSHDEEQHCIDLVEESVSAESGIVGVELNPETQQLTIDYDPAQTEQADIERVVSVITPTLEQRWETCTMRLGKKPGRACESCALAIERQLAAQQGIQRATASYRGGVLSVTYDTDLLTPDQIAVRVSDMGVPLVADRTAVIVPESTTATGRAWRWIRTHIEAIFVVITLFGMIGGLIFARQEGASTASAVFYAIAYVTGGYFGLRAGIASLRQRTVDIDLLMIMAAIGAVLVGQPFEGVMLLFLFSLSNVLQDYALDRTRSAISSLMELRPDEALVQRGDRLVTLPIERVNISDRIIVKPGERLPMDGVIVDGEASIDQASITGESIPVRKVEGDTVFAGTINTNGHLTIGVTKLAKDSTLARLIKMVEEAHSEKAKTQRWIDTFEQYYAVGVIVFTALVFFVPWLFLGEAAGAAFYRAMTVMVAASPCALVISTPATVLSAIGNGARRGVLFKGGVHVENAATVKVVTFDKTGTLTEGKPHVTDVLTLNGQDEDELLALAAAVERKSQHPLAEAIVRSAESRNLTIPATDAFLATTGQGVVGTVGGREIAIGNARYFADWHVAGLDSAEKRIADLQDMGKTAVIIAELHDGTDATILGVIAIADVLRPDVARIVQSIKDAGVDRVVMLTGDNARVAKAIAAQAGVDDYYADLMPEDKVRIVNEETEHYGPVAMVGDGVNDAPALATAKVGVAMGAAGTDVAMESADVVLMSDDLSKIPYTIALSRKTRRVLIANLSFALGMIVIMIGAIFFYELPLPLAVLGHEGGTVLVSLNGLRLLGYRYRG